ncbi:MAG: EamA family transporter [Austwickia sp.]|nr:EamA family transporter [Austwickia sp.]
MPRKDAALAVTVAVVWGVNFVAAAIAMESLPPLLFAALRFTLVAIPAVFFVRPPGNGWATVVGCGAAMGVGQFGLLYTALAWGMPAGLASLVLQVQTVFTVVIASLWLRERPTAYQLSGIAVGLAGMAIIGAKHVAVAPILPFLMTMGAAAAWALGHVLTRRRPPRDGFSLVVWSALVSPVPLLALSLALEGPERDWAALGQLTPRPLVALAFVTYGASMVGYGLWNLLLSRHAASTVAPWSMLVPPVGSIAAYVYNGEQPGVLGLVGGAVVTVGVLMALGVRLGVRRQGVRRPDPPRRRPAIKPPGL